MGSYDSHFRCQYGKIASLSRKRRLKATAYEPSHTSRVYVDNEGNIRKISRRVLSVFPGAGTRRQLLGPGPNVSKKRN